MHLQKRVDVTTIPLPKVVPTSGDFDGNDGKWSTFLINVNSDNQGLNGQDFKVLVSTSSALTLLPAPNEQCNPDCAAKHGVLTYNGKQVTGVQESENWQDAGILSIPLPYWYSNDYTGYNSTPRGVWGTTNVGLGHSSAQSLVNPGLYAVKYTSNAFFMGSFGLAAGEVGGQGATKPTFLSQFKDLQTIASPSYGYTAGAWYRNNRNGVPGSLVLGGYDKSRMARDGLSLPMPNNKNNTLVVGVPSILYRPDQDVEANQYSFTANTTGGFRANIDSTLPYLILPDWICDEFQKKFRLTYDNETNFYTVNSSAHNWNAQQNATVTFQLAAGPLNSADLMNIQLPYDAFDLQLSETGANGTNYFPIKKSKDGVYILGRTFLQEAYIIVDYERANFTVAPASNPNSLPKEDLKIIYNTTYHPGAGTPDSDGGLAPGAIAGTVVGIVVAFAIAGIVAFCWWRKRKNKREVGQKHYATSQIDPTLAGQEIKHRRVSELTGSDLPSSPKTPLAGYYTADHKSVPPISEMSPDSPPVELYSPPPESASDIDGGRDYFTAGKPHRRGAQRDRASSGHNTPGTPIAELPGDDAQFHTPGTQFDAVSPLNSPLHSRGPSDTSLLTNIDERLADNKKDATRPAQSAETGAAVGTVGPKNEVQAETTTEAAAERRPSHQRGLSDTTIASDSTAVSQPTPEEQERWAREPRRPLSE
ncbi:acid protease [Macroventuria anomochaeta]|uniref:Acid protease n=1 Tax=Macroventuria anomochaeta TaxID=301207 RepID=A0ACB6RZZ2_9PLEO|nr:acid protease [Macroventuria anomochaeta]KAF2627451.1 acid protease [Macroventuria anomochaeta]